jgi:hypothetical protein
MITKRKPGARRQLPGPAFVVPPKMDRVTQRKVQQLIDAQLEELTGRKRREHVPHLHRWRFQLVPLVWLAAALAGLAVHEIHIYLAAALAALVSMAAAVAATRQRAQWTRAHVQGMTAWAAAWALAFAFVGAGWWGGVWELGWALPSAAWLEHYRWRGPAVQKQRDTRVEDIWRELAAKQNWKAWLGPVMQIPGGARYPVVCQGAHTHIGQITGKPDEVAAAFDASLTTAYTEPHGSAVRSRGWLTLLRGSTLDEPRPWDGGTIDQATGLAVIGRFPEGGDVHECWFTPGVGGGARHAFYAGCDGSGKTGALDLGMCISVSSGIICPVILDPQMGQALPAWQEAVPYACGTEQCMTYLRGLYSGMMARSEYLAGVQWTHPRSGRTRRGMGWFDPFITGLPIIEIVIDEAPILLAVRGASQLVLDICKLGRKVGFRVKLAAQVPSIAEMKAAELRSILNGGTAVCLRTGDKVSGGMMNITARPYELPLFFPSGAPTRGLGYARTIENRPGVAMRTDWIDEERLYDFAESCEPRPFDPAVAKHLDWSLRAEAARVASLREGADDEASQQLRVLAALQRPMSQGELIVACDGLAVSQVVTAVRAMEKDGRLRFSGDMVERI